VIDPALSASVELSTVVEELRPTRKLSKMVSATAEAAETQRWKAFFV
jgi:hypothetical protein